MLRRTHFKALGLGAMSALALACGESETRPIDKQPLRPIQADSALTLANQNVRDHLAGAARAAIFITESDLLDDILDGPDACAPTAPGEPSNCGEPAEDLEGQANEMAAELADRILNMSNVETSEETRVVLRVRPEIACLESDGTTIDPDCQDLLTDLPVRIELTSRAEGSIDIQVLVGSNNVLDAGLYASSAWVELDLGALLAAAREYEQATGETLELPASASGRIRGELTENGTLDYTARLGVSAAISVAGSYQGEAYSVTVAQANPAITIHLNGNTPEISTDLLLNAIGVQFPIFESSDSSAPCVSDPSGNVTCPEPPPPSFVGTLGVNVAGASSSMRLDGSDVLEITNVSAGNGTTVVTMDGQQVFAFDLNPSNGRRLDLAIESAPESLIARVTPAFHVRADVDFRHLVGKLDEVPSFLLDEVFELRLDGAAEPAVRLIGGFGTSVTVDDAPDRVPPPDDGSGGGGGAVPPPPPPPPDPEPTTPSQILEVLAGNLSLSAQNAGISVQIAAGMCLEEIAETQEPAPGSEPHPLSQLTSAVCQ